MYKRGSSIPDPTSDIGSLVASVSALKQVVENLTGQRGGTAYGSPKIWVQVSPPTGAVVGDFWIHKQTNKLRFWDGANWQNVYASV